MIRRRRHQKHLLWRGDICDEICKVGKKQLPHCGEKQFKQRGKGTELVKDLKLEESQHVWNSTILNLIMHIWLWGFWKSYCQISLWRNWDPEKLLDLYEVPQSLAKLEPTLFFWFYWILPSYYPAIKLSDSLGP